MFTTQYVGSCYIKNGVYKMPPQGSAGRTAGLDGARQIAPPTKNGHAPPPIESRKSSQSVNPYYVWTW
jgi:hypothetical protein